MKIKLFIYCIILSLNATAQSIKGKVSDATNSALIGVNVSWVGDPGSAVMTDENGMFSIVKSNSTNLLSFSYLGFKPDTLKL